MNLPSYTYAMSLENDVEVIKETLTLASKGKLKAVMDECGPFPFTIEGVQEAFEIQASHRAKGKGKIVIQIE